MGAPDAVGLNSVLKTVLLRSSEKLRALPHRDVTRSRYMEWIQLYVKALHDLSGHPSEGVCGANGEVADLPLTLKRYRREMDAMLLSSVLSTKWTEVHVPSSFEEKPLRECEWWNAAGFDECSAREVDESDVVSEVCTPEFLTEPLKGGRTISAYVGFLKHIRRPPGASARAAEDGLDSPPPSRLVLPFSSLWTIRSAAYGFAGMDGRGAAPSFQDRQMRLRLLKTLNFAFQLGRDVLKEEAGSSAVPPLVRVLRPTEEFEAICRLPRVREILGGEGGDTDGVEGLSMQKVCSSTVARLVYLSYASSLLTTRGGFTVTPTAGTEEDARIPPPLRASVLLAPAHAQRQYRTAGARMVRDSFSGLEYLDSKARGGAAAPSTSLPHQDARKGCKDAARRLTVREDNIRQALSLR